LTQRNDRKISALDRQFSRYLDLLRVVAALLVLLAHLADPAISDGVITVPDQIGYSSVMIFFVLSGYVISYVAVERETRFVDFAISRLARVYSVVLPALALTIAADLLFLWISPRYHTDALLSEIPLYQYVKFPKYLVMDIFFGNNIWGLRQTAFSNGAYWSMCFEVYYYVVFVVAFYFRGPWRIILLIAVPLAIGPGPFLRFPLWLLGCSVYWLHRRYAISTRLARLIFVLTIALLVVDLATDVNLRIDDRLDLLTHGWVTHSILRRVAGDTLTGAIVALNIFAARYAGLQFGRLGWWFTYLASFSFSLYLMHTPLLRLCAGYWHPGPLPTAAAVLAAVWLLGQVTERQKDSIRNLLRRLIAARSQGFGASGA
jgi:peptidoglycan/LPS O-acetylase OafA/YrhL